jgi:CubicO group peptidase (beta-lactamase class C family)
MEMPRAIIVGLLLLLAVPALAKPLSAEQKQAIDAAVGRILKASQVPSASIAVVTDGNLDYAKAYGDQRLDGSAPTIFARYPVASISKQFTAAAILLLVEEGKMSLDDKVGKYLPTLTAANTITVRELLGHTSGYRDFWPQDFQFEAMTKATTSDAILDHWAKAPLDYIPGTKWQYSNTGYTAAGRIFEQVAKERLQSFEQRRIFKPLGMDVVLAATGLSKTDAKGTTRAALGPIRPALLESDGWVFAAGDLAMTPSELAKWNIARLNRTVLKPQSWQLQETNVAAADVERKYGLGVALDTVGRHPRIQHGGAFTGYLSSNRVYPADHAAITVFINGGFSNSQDAIADAIEAILFDDADETRGPLSVFNMLRTGQIDRAKFTDNGNFYFTPTVLSDYRSSLESLGEPTRIQRHGEKALRGGLTVELYIFTFVDRKLLCIVRADPDSGRIEQYTLYPYSD